MTPAIIRQAFVDDLASLVPMGKSFSLESKFVKFNEDVFLGTWERLIGTGNGVVFVAESDSGEIIGGIGLLRFASPHSGELTAMELFWYVSPEFRGDAGIRLLAQAEKWAKRSGCISMMMIHLADCMPDKIKGIYTKNGYDLMETHWVKEL